MIIIDSALRARADAGNPIRVGMIGAGFMGRGIANQILNSVPGMDLVAIANRNPISAMRAYNEAGIAGARQVYSVSELEASIATRNHAITDNPMLLCQAQGIDALIEVTGTVEFAAHAVLEAIGNKKHVVLMNAELDGTVGPILRTYAEQAGVILSGCDGDQPGVEMNLFRFVKSLGLTPLVCGNIKGLQDPYRTPTTQRGFAERWGQNPHMVTSFADGTKISFEQAIVANATAMTIAKRGMLGYDFALHGDELVSRFNLDWTGHVDDLTQVYDVEQLKELGGIVDYVVGVKPAPGVFVLGAHEDPKQRHYLDLYKLGKGPLYCFYTPYHLCHFEVPLSVARAVLFRDAVLSPISGPRVDVVATAKRDIREGESLDGIGGYMLYGQCETARIVASDRLLPMGLAEGCLLTRDVAKDQVLTYDDVHLPEGRLCDSLRAEQDRRFATDSLG